MLESPEVNSRCWCVLAENFRRVEIEGLTLRSEFSGGTVGLNIQPGQTEQEGYEDLGSSHVSKPLENLALDILEPQARPVAEWIIAAKNSNMSLFKSAYSPKIRTQFEKEELWREGLEEVRNEIAAECGLSYSLDDFEFSFTGNELSGRTSIIFKGTEVFDMAVANQGDGWKLNEL